MRGFLEGGGQVVGNVAGVAVSVVAGPLLGTSAGVAMGQALPRVGTEFYDRILAPRQLARAGGALSVAVARIGERLDAGDELRTDGFFDTGFDGRADADEVLEGTLMTAANAWEERKVAPLGRLYANLAFDSSITPGCRDTAFDHGYRTGRSQNGRVAVYRRNAFALSGDRIAMGDGYPPRRSTVPDGAQLLSRHHWCNCRRPRCGMTTPSLLIGWFRRVPPTKA